MPRFFFPILDREVVPDIEGSEMLDLAAARRAAADILADRLKGSGEEFWQMRRWRVDVIDQTGATLATLAVVAESVE